MIRLRLAMLLCFMLPFFGSVTVCTCFGQPPKEWGSLTLVDEIDCSSVSTDNTEVFSEYPGRGASSVERLCSTSCRVLKPTDESPKYMAFLVGAKKNLQPGAAYVLCVDFPEDTARSMFIHNGGNETVNGVGTGTTTGDVMMGRYVNHNPESLHYPLSGRIQTWTGLFFLHDRFPNFYRPRGTGDRPRLPDDGFWVIVSQSYGYLDPMSAGAAVSKIRLYKVNDESKLALKVNYPPKDLPQRRLFWREEMADGAIAFGNSKSEQDEKLRGVKNLPDWYEFKMKWSRAMGVNTFCKDLLEFGHNQGWDSEPYGGNNWVYKPSYFTLWDKVVALAAKYEMPILPYYEYYGSIGGNKDKALGLQKRAVRLDGKGNYTHIWWGERANVDLSDPDTLADFQKILNLTVLKYKDGVADADGKTVHPTFIGAWLRNRPSNQPVSFNDRNLADFAREANGGTAVTREKIKADKDLRQKYYQWWFGQRRKFIENVAGYLKKNVNPESFVLYTTDSSEPGWSIPSEIAGEGKKDGWKYKTSVVNDDHQQWEKILDQPRYRDRFLKSIPLDEVVSGHWYPKSLQTWQLNWGGWEVSHAMPIPDPLNYKDCQDAMFSYTINRSYSADTDMDQFRSQAGLTCVRHFPLNENEMNVKQDGKEVEPLGYFIADCERAGAFCVMPEVMAVAKGDPTQIGYLTGGTFQRGFPQYVRAFNAAYLALPALNSTLVQSEKYGKEWVRKIDAGSGRVWFAVCNLDWEKKTFPVDELSGDGQSGDGQSGDGQSGGTLVDCVTGERIRIINGTAKITSLPMSLRSFRLEK